MDETACQRLSKTQLTCGGCPDTSAPGATTFVTMPNPAGPPRTFFAEAWNGRLRNGSLQLTTATAEGSPRFTTGERENGRGTMRCGRRGE